MEDNTKAFGSNFLQGIMKGTVLFRAVEGCKYQIKFSATSPKVALLYKNANSAVNYTEGVKRAGAWIMRIDTPHLGADYNHININPRVSHMPDPHLKLPPGGVTAARGTAKFCQLMNQLSQAALICVVTVDILQIGNAIHKDCQQGTTVNTAKKVTHIAASWGGAYAGAKTGMVIGGLVLPGLGTIAGGFIGAISGGVYGSMGASYVTQAIGGAYQKNASE